MLRSISIYAILAVLCCLPELAGATTITVDASNPGLRIPREIYGNNACWPNFNKYYRGSATFPPDLLDDIRDMGMGSFRYPGGIMADMFTWETTIGPKNKRAIQWKNGCVAPGQDFGTGAFGVDEFLGLCEQIGTEPQLTLMFRAADTTSRFQAESTCVVVVNHGQIGLADLNLDEGTSLSLPSIGDAVKFTFSVPRDGYYKLSVRNRAGTSSDSSAYWKANAFTYQIDGAALPFTGDDSTISTVDPADGATTWGTTRSDIVYLHYGSHELTVTSSATGLRLDYLDVQGLNHDNAVKRAMAWIAYCNCSPSDTRPIGVDQAGVDWGTVGSWAQKRVTNGHAEPYAVKFWEVGNEAWGVDCYGSPPGQNGSIYNAAWIDYYNATRTIDPCLRLSLCGYTSSTWTNTLIQGHGDKANYIHFHPYYPNDKTTTDPNALFLAGVSSSTGVQNYLNQYRSTINAYQPGRLGKIKGSASEWSACYGWDNPNEDWAVRMTGVLAVADQLGVMTKNTDLLESAQYWNLFAGKVCPFQLFTNPDGSSGRHKHGIYEALKQYGTYFGDQVLPATVSADCPTYYFAGRGSNMPAGNYAMLTAYASQDSSSYYLVVINKDPLNARQANLIWQGLPDATNRVMVRTIASSDPLPNYASINTQYASPIAVTTTSLTPYTPSSSHSFPACSVTGFVMEKAKPANLTWHREAEDIFTIHSDIAPYGNTITTGPSSYDSGGHVVLGDAGDVVVLPFNVRKKQPYTIRIRNRSGQAGSSTLFWDSTAYNYALDGKSVSFASDAASISPLDSGSIYWGTVELRGQKLEVGRHYLKITAAQAQCMLDWIEVEEDRCESVEADSAYSVITNASGLIAVTNLGLDSGSHVRVGDGDVVEFSLTAPRSVVCDVLVRVRSGDPSGDSRLLPCYNWSIDGRAVAATQDTDTVSALDSDGATYWSTVRIAGQYLPAGPHTIRAAYGGPSPGRVDYLATTAAGLAVVITTPTSDAVYVTDKAKLTIGGGASDDAVRVSWVNGESSGECNKVTSWTDKVPLALGENGVVVSAYDQDGRAETDVLRVIRVAGATSISQLKELQNGAIAQLASKTVTAVFADSFYIEETDRSRGMKVKPTTMPAGIAVGALVCVSGTLGVGADGERYISGDASVQP